MLEVGGHTDADAGRKTGASGRTIVAGYPTVAWVPVGYQSRVG